MGTHELPPSVGAEFELRTPRPNWTESCLVALKARQKAGVTINEIVVTNASGAVSENVIRPHVEKAMADLVELGVVTRKGVRFFWWRFAR